MHPSAVQSEAPKYTIMLVDDEDNVLRSLRRVLAKAGDWSIIACNDPREALDIASGCTVDLFISDYRMPGMTGAEFLAFSKHRNPHAMRLILSGATDFRGLVNAINQAEIHRFINKPVQSADLIHTVKQALQLYDLVRENRELADRVRRQQRELDKRETVLRRYAETYPSIVRVNWGPGGSILLDEGEAE